MSASFPTSFTRSMIVVAGAASLAGCGINSIPTAEEQAKAKWADVQAAFQERANLYDNLAAIAKGAGANEKGILVGVTEARAKATSVQVTPGDLSDPAKMKAFQDAQGQLGAGIGRLMVSVEAYPNIKSNDNYLALQSQVEGSENRIRVAIRDYNEAVRQYNTEIRTFPSVVGAKVIYGSKPLVPYEAVTPGAEKAPSLEGKL